jgi:hypothetical protein
MTDPHSRACGFRAHEHGSACHRNCPTCQGLPRCILSGCTDPGPHPVTFTLDGTTPLHGQVCDEHHRIISRDIAAFRLGFEPHT